MAGLQADLEEVMPDGGPGVGAVLLSSYGSSA